MLPRGIQTKDGLLTFSAIHQRFSQTNHGKTLATRIRFGTYKPDSITNEEWWTILGPDVNNLHHIYTTYLITREYVANHSELTYEDKTLILLAAITHDWGEAITGDILLPLKTEAHSRKEKELFDGLLVEYLGFAIDDTIRNKIVSIVFDSSNGLGRHFRLIEEWGYFRTALKAWKHACLTDYRELQKRLNTLTYSVFANDLCSLIQATSHSTAIHTHFTQKARSIISHVCDTMPHDTHQHHVDQARKEWVKESFERAQISWKKYHSIYEKKK